MGKLRTFLSQNFRRPITNRFVKPEMTPEARNYLDNFSKILNSTLNSCDELFEYTKDKPMKEFIKAISPTITKISIEQNQDLMYLPFHTMLYLLTKKLKPDIAVETGVQIGGSTHAILKAMTENSRGVLHSVDIGKFFVHDYKHVAHIAPLVTTEEEKHWKFTCGNSQKVLPSLVNKIGMFDLFCAGHTHTYEIQKHEGELCWSHIRDGGIFVLDRADNNDNRYLNEFLDKYSSEVDFHRTYKEGRASAGLEFTVILKK